MSVQASEHQLKIFKTSFEMLVVTVVAKSLYYLLSILHHFRIHKALVTYYELRFFGFYTTKAISIYECGSDFPVRGFIGILSPVRISDFGEKLEIKTFLSLIYIFGHIDKIYFY